MKLTPHKCPECGEPATRLTERVLCLTAINEPDENGVTDWNGDCETKVMWDSSEPWEETPGKVWLHCIQGHEWQADYDGSVQP